MKKGKIIAVSIISFIILLNVVLFGTVFRLRKQSVQFVGEVNVSEQAIIDVAGLKAGSSIFMIDKNKAKNRIEIDFPYLKVVEINTVSPIEIKFSVRQRHEMYYQEVNGWKYILDEDLKILDKRESLTTEQADLINVIFDLGITDTTEKSTFVGSGDYQKLSMELFVALYTSVKLKGEYLDRADIRLKISSIDLVKVYDKTDSYLRLKIKTDDGTTIDIAKPYENIKDKINYCFAVYDKLDLETRTNAIVPYNLDTDESMGYYYIVA